MREPRAMGPGRNGQEGLTLVELLIVAGVLAIIIPVVVLVLRATVMTDVKWRESLRSTARIRYVVSALSKDFRTARRARVVGGRDDGLLQLYAYDGREIRYLSHGDELWREERSANGGVTAARVTRGLATISFYYAGGRQRGVGCRFSLLGRYERSPLDMVFTVGGGG